MSNRSTPSTSQKRRWSSGAACGVTSLALLGLAAPAFAAAPANDNFANAKSVRIGSTINGTVKGATRQAGEPHHANSANKRSVWYRFRPSRRVAVGLNSCNSDFDTVIAVYTGSKLRRLRAVDYNDDGCGTSGGGSRVVFTAKAGRTYRIALAGPSGSASHFRLTVRKESVPPNDDFEFAESLELGVTASGTTKGATRELNEAIPPGQQHSVWYKLRLSAQKSVSLSVCESSTYQWVTVYTGGKVSALTRVAGDEDCVVQFTAQPGVTYRISVTQDAGLGSPFKLRSRAL